MNNEINKSHEEILEKYRMDTDEFGNWVFYPQTVLKAMAEVAGLRDKEVEIFESMVDNQKNTIKSQRKELTAKDKEIEQLKAKMAEMSAFVNPLKEGWKDEF